MTDLVRPAVAYEVRINGRKTPWLVPTQLGLALGGQQADVCRLRSVGKRTLNDTSVYNAAREVTDNQPLGALNQRPWNGEVEVYLNRGKGLVRVFWGAVSGSSYSADTETWEIEARVARFHFGFPMVRTFEGAPWNRNTVKPIRKAVFGETPISVDRSPVFNPIIDGVVRGNKVPKQLLFLDWESRRTKAAAQGWLTATISDEYPNGKDDERQFVWLLHEAVAYLLAELNPDSKYIQNPKESDIELALRYESGLYESPETYRELVRNVQIPLGAYLHEALDRLLEPLGFIWWIDYAAKPKPEFRFGVRGSGPKRALPLDRIGKPFEVDRNTVGRFSAGTGWQSLANAVALIGGKKRFETSIELRPAWPNDFDELDPETDLAKDSDNYNLHPEYHRVLRDFVANESGEYKEIRAHTFEGTANWYDRVVFPGDNWLSYRRRRKIHPCLTRRRDGAPIGENGVVVEWWNGSTPSGMTTDEYDAWDASDKWRPLEELEGHGEVQLLTQEIGVRFNGRTIPPEVAEAKGDFRLRITCTIEADEHLKHFADRLPTSLQPATAAVVIEAAERFQYAQVAESSKFYKQLHGSKAELNAELYADERDDTDAIQEYAEYLRERLDHLDVSGSAVIGGFDLGEYELGDVVTKIEGREIRFDATTKPDGSYPQIVGLVYHFESQMRELIFETSRNTPHRIL